MMALKISAVMVALALCQVGAQRQLPDYPGGGCNLGAQQVNFPRQLYYSPSAANEYLFLESGLTVFFDLRFPCDGVINYYTFLASESVVKGLHLAIIRPTGANTYSVVGDTYINNWVTGTQPDQYVTWKLTQGVIFKAGDYVGMFYDRIAVQRKQPTLRSTMKTLNGSYNARTSLSDAEKLSADGFVFSRDDGVPTMRTPALYVTVNFLPPAGATSANSVTTTGATFSTNGGSNYWTSSYDGLPPPLVEVPTSAPPANSLRKISCTLMLQTSVYECTQISTIRFVYYATNSSCSELISCGQRTSNLPPGYSNAGDLFCQLNCITSRKKRDAELGMLTRLALN